MKRKIIIVFCIPFFLYGEVIKTSLVWKKDDLVQNLYSTPIGYVYKFSSSGNTSNLFSFLPKAHAKDCNCETCKYCRQSVDGGTLEIDFSKQKKMSLTKHYLAIDFIIRAFPALSRFPTSDFQFLLIDSEYQISRANYYNLNGMWRITNSADVLYSTSDRNASLQTKSGARLLLPEFDPIHVRFIYDLQNTEVCFMNFQYSSFIAITTLKSKKARSFKKKKIAISVVNNNDRRTEYFEISNPIVYQCDTQAELKILPKIEYTPYPYSNYILKEKNKIKITDTFKILKRDKNPDLQYAYALRYLYGSQQECDPEKGIELLKEAIKKNHVMALYQLGICFFRGYGVEVDYKKSFEYLEKSKQYGYSSAETLRWFIEFQTSNYPWFANKRLNRERKKIIPYNRFDHDYVFISGIFSSFLPTAMVSPKLLLSSLYVEHCRDFQNLSYLDYVLKSEYPNAYWSKAIFLENSNQEKYHSLLKQGILKGNKQLCPELILFRLKTNDAVTKNDFLPLYDLLYSDDPLYHIVSLTRGNVQYSKIYGLLEPKGNLFLTHDELTRAIPNQFSDSNLLHALVILYNLRLIRYMTEEKVIEYLNKAFMLLKKAADDNNNPIAQYWLGRCYFYNDLPEHSSLYLQNDQINRIYEAKRYLKKATDSKFLPAMYLLAKLELSQKNRDVMQIVSLLKTPVAIGYPPALYLIAKHYYLLQQDRDAAKYALLAAKAGEPQGWHLSAIIASKQKKQREANLFWYNFMRADLEKRRLDPFDMYWPEKSKELNHGWFLHTTE